MRKPISKKMRFEVFKRDNFTCQYCGEKAPNVILEVDHIEPVSKGGTNSMMNLVTSCYDCNRGKGARELSDDSLIQAERNQLEILNEKREQIKLIARWKKELQKFETEQIELINEELKALTSFSLVEPEFFRPLIKKYGYAILSDALNTAVEWYFKGDKASIQKILDNLLKVCNIKVIEKTDPFTSKKRYIIGILRNRRIFYQESEINNLLKLIQSEEDFQVFRDIASTSDHSIDFIISIKEYYGV